MVGSVQWEYDKSPAATPGRPGLHLLHVLISKTKRLEDDESNEEYPNLLGDTEFAELNQSSSPQVAYLTSCIKDHSSSTDSNTTIRVTFILPYSSGWIIRSDFLQLRLQALQKDWTIETFVNPLRQCQSHGDENNDRTEFHGLLQTAVGAITHRKSSLISHHGLLKTHLLQRLTYTWLSPDPIPYRRVALVRGRSNLESGQLIYDAARALGVSLVIIDVDGHWLQADSAENTRIREAFITTDLRHGPHQIENIVAAVKSYREPIHGIFTVSDDFLVPVSEAAERLGLPTSPSSAHRTAFDKFLSRSVQASAGEFTTVASSDDLHQQLKDGRFIPRYPLIAKPRTRGWSSENVFKVRDETELLVALARIWPGYKDGAVIEPYFDGPELDIDFVLRDGHVLYHQITDEQPSPGDLPGPDGSAADFQETSMMLPSMLPVVERRCVYKTMLDLLDRLGFRTGVFHVEARLTNSSVEYRSVTESDTTTLLDLVPKSDPFNATTTSTPLRSSDEQVRVHLIEINARPPGFPAIASHAYTCGIDLFAARILAAVGDNDRLESTSTPFDCHLPGLTDTLKFENGVADKDESSTKTISRTEGAGMGAACWSHLLFFPVMHAGVMTEDERIERLWEMEPQAATSISWSVCMFKPGDNLPDPQDGAAIFAAAVISSTESRQTAMRVAQILERRFRQSWLRK